ncbi:beta-3-deoxy-D-manno-oct-2-ulosonic acid transferase [Tabrizicola sp. TH137]|uniref:capsular polysaccharide biosynthesis protein n=1 Tax=Tabrizicola sp. TH137 TaxID=2067452 RepID=UPI000C7A936E|nr:capsular polysaccharide biosynthesis protein [Tabrizicola sp. TH137]PLL11419.1 beta-3-deoxy-D-manno-oct-2-ulosonic acid transferase [Tabrizicola sp. TH137]
MPDQTDSTAGAIPRRLRFLNGGFLNRDLRRILAAAGHELRPGLPRPGEGVVVWGRSPVAWRGERAAARAGAPLIRVEDAFLRSLRPGRQGGRGNGPLGLLVDPVGVHFDGSCPSLIERIIATDGLDDSNLLMRARDGIARLIASDLSKYNIHDPDLPAPAAGYVLLVDQTRGDASIRYSGASEASFPAMLAMAREEHPTARILIKTHPETQAGLRPGHFDPASLPPGVTLFFDPVSPWKLLDGAIAVYTVSSQMGFEAILAGHRPRVFGQPFYAGWGLSSDEQALPRRRRSLTKAQLFAAAMILAPTWHDPCRDRLCSFEEAVDQLEADVRAWRADRHGHVALNMRLWKRRPLQQVFGRERPVIFATSAEEAQTIAERSGRRLIAWGAAPPDLPGLIRVEDGFLRSRGLGADLIPPLSLVTDDLGLYFDPTRDSRLERMILAPLPPGGAARAERLIARLTALNLSKYNLPAAPLPDLPQGRRLLVPGQVEDDASIRLGAGETRTNRALLEAVRRANPDAVILYKPHPDVEAGLRPGAIPADELAGLADMTLLHADPIALIAACDEVWTITSTLGFEALLRGKPVTTLGAPFYAGWGLTRDLGPVPPRRLRRPDGSLQPRPTLAALVHAALIAYPRYFDPVTRRPCPPEVALDRLAHGPIPHPGRANRLLAKLQGALAGHAHLWRR